MTHKGTQTLETGRLILRRFTESDAEAMFRNWASDPETAKTLQWEPHESVDVTRELIAHRVSDYSNESAYSWAIVLREIREPIGSIEARVIGEKSRVFDIGYCLGSRWWHQSIMTEAFAAVIKFLFTEVGANRIQAQHKTTNPRSGAVMRRCGLSFEGIQRQATFQKGVFHDLAAYAILAEDYFMVESDESAGVSLTNTDRQ